MLFMKYWIWLSSINFRHDQTINLTLSYVLDESVKKTIVGTSPGDSTILDVNEVDLFYIGGIPDWVEVL